MASIRDIWLSANNILRSARQLINDELRPLGLSSSEGNVLIHLLTSRTALKQDDIVAQLDVSRPAVSRALDSLERKGYVVRHRDSDDKRVNLVGPTARAAAIAANLEAAYERVFSVAAEGIPEQEARTVIEIFAKVSGSFSAALAARGNQPDAR